MQLKRAAPKAAAEADARRAKAHKITQEAAAKTWQEIKEKQEKAAEKHFELVKTATMEFLRF